MNKKEEFDSFLSPSQLMRYPVLSSTDQDTWLATLPLPGSLLTVAARRILTTKLLLMIRIRLRLIMILD